MEEEVRREIEALKGMVLAWKASHLQAAPPGEEDVSVALEFLEEIETHFYPYTCRLYECQYLTWDEANEFMSFCYSQVEDLRESLRGTAT